MTRPMNRKGETGPVPFRTGRFFSIESKWYFACREGVDRGPFDSRGDAVAALQEYLRNMDQVQKTAARLS